MDMTTLLYCIIASIILIAVFHIVDLVFEIISERMLEKKGYRKNSFIDDVGLEVCYWRKAWDSKLPMNDEIYSFKEMKENNRKEKNNA